MFCRLKQAGLFVWFKRAEPNKQFVQLLFSDHLAGSFVSGSMAMIFLANEAE